jgi:hypothetical protein
MESYSSISIEELVRRCTASRSPEAWEEFVRRFHRLIAAVILRTASRLCEASKQTVDDLIQETYLKLCADDFRVLRGFENKAGTKQDEQSRTNKAGQTEVTLMEAGPFGHQTKQDRPEVRFSSWYCAT